MTHVEEHKLELFVLDPQALAEELPAIREHLELCEGCARLSRQIRSFYLEVEEIFAHEDQRPSTPNSSLIVRREATPEIFRPVDRVPVRGWEEDRSMVRRFMRRHPVASGTGAFAFLSSCLAAVVFLTRGPGDTNPSYTHINPAQQLLEVYNREHERLWSLPADDLEGVLHLEKTYDMPAAPVADLDGDGVKEVITGIRLSSDPKGKAPPLRVFDNAGHIRLGLRPGRAIAFAGAQYNEEYRVQGIVIGESGPDGTRDLVVGATNSRSPFVITRYSGLGDVLGEYWHFGVIYGFTGLFIGGRPMIVAWGTNDMPDTSGHSNRSFAMIVLLDPDKLIGPRESACTPGFGLPLSEAERRYIRLPRSDVEEALDVSASTSNMRVERDSVLSFSTTFDAESEQTLTFVFSFTKDFTPLVVKSTDFTEAEQRRLVATGALKRPWEKSYFDSLKARIQFLR